MAASAAGGFRRCLGTGKSLSFVRPHMLKLLRTALVLLTASHAVAQDTQQSIVASLVTVSSDVYTEFEGFPKDVVRTIYGSDKIIYYKGIVSVVNPTKSNYLLSAQCIDGEGRVVIEKSENIALLSVPTSHLQGQPFYEISLFLGLNPKPGVLVPGQKLALKDESSYIFRLQVDGKLVAITRFRYFAESRPKPKQPVAR